MRVFCFILAMAFALAYCPGIAAGFLILYAVWTALRAVKPYAMQATASAVLIVFGFFIYVKGVFSK